MILCAPPVGGEATGHLAGAYLGRGPDDGGRSVRYSE
jgi:hypothetical protein